MFKFILKKLAWALLIIFVVFVLITALGYFSPQIEKYLAERRERQAQKAYDTEQKRIEETYRNDTYGGKTPEETFDMFLDALKKGDTELASKYYELSVQPKALASLKEELQKEGNLEKSVRYFSEVREKGEKKCRDVEKKSGGCTFRYTYIYPEETKVPISGTNDFILVPKGGKSDEITDFELNQYTQIWKITQPY